MENWKRELEVALEAVKKARIEILRIYHESFEVEIKADNSPVTLADKGADQIIRTMLHENFPDHAILTEESEDHLERIKNPYCWIVDPVDGTKDFVKRDNEFTTNVALSYQHEVILGVISIPVSGDIYYAIKGQGAYHIFPDGKIEKIHVNDKTTNLTMLVSHFHVSKKEEEYYQNHRDLITSYEAYGSSIKACRIASGLAEVQYKWGTGTKEWDTAASQIIVEEAGGFFLTPKGERMKYNRENVMNEEGFIIINRMENFPKE